MKTVNMLLVRKDGAIVKKAIQDDRLGGLFARDKRYKVLEDKITVVGGVTIRLVVASKSVNLEQWERLKAGAQSVRKPKPTLTKEQALVIEKNKLWLAYQASLDKLMEEAEGDKPKGDYDDVPYSQLPTVETYFEDSFTNLHREL
jgi:hypothetical protein